MWSYFKNRKAHYNLRWGPILFISPARSTTYGSNSVHFLGSLIWNRLLNLVKSSRSISEFKNFIKKITFSHSLQMFLPCPIFKILPKYLLLQFANPFLNATSLITDSRTFILTKYKNFAKGKLLHVSIAKIFSRFGNTYQDSLGFGTSLFENILLQSVPVTIPFK